MINKLANGLHTPGLPSENLIVSTAQLSSSKPQHTAGGSEVESTQQSTEQMTLLAIPEPEQLQKQFTWEGDPWRQSHCWVSKPSLSPTDTY